MIARPPRAIGTRAEVGQTFDDYDLCCCEMFAVERPSCAMNANHAVQRLFRVRRVRRYERSMQRFALTVARHCTAQAARAAPVSVAESLEPEDEFDFKVVGETEDGGIVVQVALTSGKVIKAMWRKPSDDLDDAPKVAPALAVPQGTG